VDVTVCELGRLLFSVFYIAFYEQSVSFASDLRVHTLSVTLSVNPSISINHLFNMFVTPKVLALMSVMRDWQHQYHGLRKMNNVSELHFF